MDNPKIYYDSNGDIRREEWYKDGKQHRLGRPAVIWHHGNGIIAIEEWIKNNKHHRLDGPAIIWYRNNGDIKSEYWYINDKHIKPPYKNYPLTKEQQIEMKLKYG